MYVTVLNKCILENNHLVWDLFNLFWKRMEPSSKNKFWRPRLGFCQSDWFCVSRSSSLLICDDSAFVTDHICNDITFVTSHLWRHHICVDITFVTTSHYIRRVQQASWHVSANPYFSKSMFTSFSEREIRKGCTQHQCLITFLCESKSYVERTTKHTCCCI